jgi:hypothetical protein
MRLAGHWAEGGERDHEPGEGGGAGIAPARQQHAVPFGKVQQDGAGFEQHEGRGAVALLHQDRDLAVRVQRQDVGRELLPRADVDRGAPRRGRRIPPA